MRLSETAVDQLFRHHNRTLNGLARSRVGWEDAEDVIQEAYLRLLELDNAGELADARGYLFRIASNLAIDWLRKRRTRSAWLLENVEVDGIAAGECGCMTAVEAAMMMCKLLISLSQLPRYGREALLLSRLYGLSYPEIAEVLGVSLRTVNRNISRADECLQFAIGTEIEVDKDERRLPTADVQARDDGHGVPGQILQSHPGGCHEQALEGTSRLNDGEFHSTEISSRSDQRKFRARRRRRERRSRSLTVLVSGQGDVTCVQHLEDIYARGSTSIDARDSRALS